MTTTIAENKDNININKNSYIALKTDLEKMINSQEFNKTAFMDRFPSDIGDDSMKKKLEEIRAKLNPSTASAGTGAGSGRKGRSRRSRRSKQYRMKSRKNRK